MTINQITNVELLQRVAARWEKILLKAQVPRKSWTVGRPAYDAVVYGNNKDAVINFIFEKQDEWSRGYTFIVEGNGTYKKHEAQNIRRQLGNGVIVSAVGYVVTQDPDIEYPIAQYIDFNTLKSSLLRGQIEEDDFVVQMAAPHYLHIAEIGPLQIRKEEARTVVLNRLDNLLRRRKDEEKVTVMSFRKSSIFLNENVVMGDELQSIFSLSDKYGTIIDRANRIVKIATSPIRKEGD